MANKLTQPKGSISKETNKEAIARLFGIKKTAVGYISTSVLIDPYTILYDESTETCWYRGTATGTPISWIITNGSLTLQTTSGQFALIKTQVDINLRQEITGEVGYSNIGKVSSVTSLRSIEPTTNGQQIILNQINSTLGTTTGGIFCYDSSDVTSIDDGYTVIVTATGKRWKRPENYIDMAWFGALNPAVDFSDAWDAAVAIVSNYVSNVGFYGRKAIYLKAGTYKPSRQLDIPSYVSVVAIGNVTIDGSGMPDNSYVIRIINKVSGISTTYHKGWNLGSIGGTFRVLGNTLDGNVDGIFVGNTSNMSDVRNVILYGVSIGGVRYGLTFGSINTYLFTATDCHIESTIIGIYVPNTTSSNSGERMTFNDCTIGGSRTNHIQISQPGFDVNFTNCSFDFTSGNVFYGTSTWGYSKVSFTSCHMEGYNGLLLSAESPQSSSVGSNRSIIMNNITNLSRLRSNTTGTNSSSRLHIDAKSTPVYINGLDQRHEVTPYLEDCLMCSDETILYINGYIKDPYFQLPSNTMILNKGYNMGDEVVGTVVNSTATLDALTRYTCVDRNAMSATVITGGTAGTQLQVTGAGGYFNLATKSFIPVTVKNRLGLYLSLSALDSTGNIQCTFSVAWYDVNDNLISTSSASSINMRTVFNDTTLPNYSDGNSRYIATPSRTFNAPVGAVKCKPRWQVSGFTGNINVSRMVSFILAG
ncbi:putative tail fiber protein [Klebsiella phage K64-1]|uniref:Depolymerase, capsule K11-specific n=1 Tax=Klebsiella phage K64-1 TaxID=1439894 RepID=DPO11_BPK64|nr:tail fiber protein [Klebsiella phage K64-1]A0A0A8JBQ8.1 RecName: Full=Depolymerase, capsule K11-specific; AltName: Full=Probable tail fiber protein [Klebsiella phage K64-1]BAQ02837.1 putative tail fiber protein [Klebsiella phage K64-1]BAW85694.1 tail fiber protein [Klebsiella phage K64-1]